MPKTKSHNSPLAVAYATSLLELANESKQTEAIAGELSMLRQVVGEHRSFKLYLSDPGIGSAERGAAIKRIFGGKVSQLMSNFLGVLNEKNRLGTLSEIADAYDNLLAEQLGKIEVDVTVAARLTAEQLEEVRKKVGAALKKDAVVNQIVDESIIGGLVVRVQDKLLDASVRTQLKAMREQLLASSPK